MVPPSNYPWQRARLGEADPEGEVEGTVDVEGDGEGEAWEGDGGEMRSKPSGRTAMVVSGSLALLPTLIALGKHTSTGAYLPHQGTRSR